MTIGTMITSERRRMAAVGMFLQAMQGWREAVRGTIWICDHPIAADATQIWEPTPLGSVVRVISAKPAPRRIAVAEIANVQRTRPAVMDPARI